MRSFLDAMAARDLPAAEAMLAPGFRMVFPGPVEFTSLTELVGWGGQRYRSVAKRYDRFDTLDHDGQTIVYCYGTLYGEWLDGTAFEGIRFIDRFEVANDLLVRQDVWNDLGEVARDRP